MDVGARLAGAQLIFANDNDPNAATSHARFFPEAEFAATPVEEVEAFPAADLVIGGYPCQSFSMGGLRRPAADPRTQLFRQFARCVDSVAPRFFMAENVSGLRAIQKGRFLEEQLEAFSDAGPRGYTLACRVIRAEDYGLPQRRKRLFIVGVRRDLAAHYWFPEPTHERPDKAAKRNLTPWASHGDALGGLPLWPSGEFYERPHDPEGHFAWYYMSRNRKARWGGPSFTVVANWRHVTLHPASPVMKLTWSNLADGWKQRWDFAWGEYEHLDGHPERPVLEEPRRLSWRECARIQTFPDYLVPDGSTESKIEQIGNAVPPLLAENLLRPLITGEGLRSYPSPDAVEPEMLDQLSLLPVEAESAA